MGALYTALFSGMIYFSDHVTLIKGAERVVGGVNYKSVTAHVMENNQTYYCTSLVINLVISIT